MHLAPRRGRRARRHGRRHLVKELLSHGALLETPKERVARERNGTRPALALPGDAELFELRRKVANIVVDDFQMINARAGAVKVPGLDRHVQLGDLPPPAR